MTRRMKRVAAAVLVVAAMAACVRAKRGDDGNGTSVAGSSVSKEPILEPAPADQVVIETAETQAAPKPAQKAQEPEAGTAAKAKPEAPTKETHNGPRTTIDFSKDEAKRLDAPREMPEPMVVAPAPPPPVTKDDLSDRGSHAEAVESLEVVPEKNRVEKKAERDEEENAGESYHSAGINPFVTAAEDRYSTFSIDVDTASYTIARRKLLEGQLPPRDAVRVEEFLNYFKYDLPAPEKDPFSVMLDAAPSPFVPDRTLMRVALQGRRVKMSERKAAHLTFLVDVSGSMMSPDKLPLAKKALRILVDHLRDGDTVALVTYAGGVREVLPPTGLEKKAEIHAAIESLTAGGSTAMNDGLSLAYREAAKVLTPDSISRVIVLSDGDANVGPSSQEELLKTISGHVKEGVTLSVCGFGMGNYKDDVMEALADKGNGNYFYVDSILQARRVFEEQLGGTLEVIAQDVKLQVEFDPSVVKRYRLVGYENRDIADKDFRNDKVDAGEMGSGHSVTAMYELELAPGAQGKSLATVRVRAKKPRGVNAEEWVFPMKPQAVAKSFAEASADFRFATSVMAAAEKFRQSELAKPWSFPQIQQIAREASPPGNYERAEFLHLLEKSQNVIGNIASR